MIFFYLEVAREDIRKHTDDHAIVHLLSNWEIWEARDGSLPTFTAERRAALEWCYPNLIELEKDADGEWLYGHFGDRIVEDVGYTLSGMRLSDLPADISEAVGKTYHKVCSTGGPLYTTHKTSITKTKNTWERLILPFRNLKGDILLLVFSLPVTHRYQIINTLIEANSDGVITLSAQRSPDGEIRDFLIEDANEPACGMFNGLRVDVVNATISKDYPDLYRTDFYRVAQHTCDTGQPVKIDVAFNLNNRFRWLRVSCAKMSDGVVMVLSDVTEDRQKHAIAKGKIANLSRRNTYQTALYQAAPSMLCTINDEGCVVDANKAWLSELGLNRAQTIGSQLNSFITDGTTNLFRQYFSELYSTGKVKDKPVEILAANGVKIRAKMSANMVTETVDSLWQAVVYFETERNSDIVDEDQTIFKESSQPKKTDNKFDASKLFATPQR